MNTPSGVATFTIPASSVPQWMTRLKMDPIASTAAIGNINVTPSGYAPAGTLQSAMIAATSSPTTASSIQGTQLLGTIDCYEDVFKEITKKLYGDDATGGVAISDVLDSALVSTMGAMGSQQIVYDTSDLFRQDVITSAGGGALSSTNAMGSAGGGLAIVAAPGSNGLPAGTILVQRRLQDDKGRIWTIEGLPHTGDQIAFATVAASDSMQTNPPPQQTTSLQQTTTLPLTSHQQQQQVTANIFEERWFESDEQLTWTQSKIARYNPTQKVFRCVDCDFVGFLSRVAEHWLGNHADLRVFQCPRCPYTSAWARCVRMHLTRQHGETLADNSLWKENPVLEEVTKFLNTLKTKVEQKVEPPNPTGEKRYTCPYCPYQTDRRDLYNRHENIHREEKPFQCYVCDKQFNRADHVKKHFIRMHREHPYDINKIRKAVAKQLGGGIQLFNGGKMASATSKQQSQPTTQQIQFLQESQVDSANKPVKGHQMPGSSLGGQIMTSPSTSSNPITGATMSAAQTQQQQQQQLPHIAYFNPPSAPADGQNQIQSTGGPLQGISGVGGTKKEGKSKGHHRKKKSHEKMYTCSYCPWQGVDNWCLKRHLNTHIKPFLCALCDYKAARSERLATHVLKVHNKRVCHKCSFLADDSESLSQHIQDSHQNPLVKTGFNCNICHEYFELRADLEAHAILEHQKVIVQCDLCDFRTTDELSMEAHLRDKHNLTPGMGAVAAAAAAAAAAAIGQPVNTQYMQAQNQPQLNLNEPMTSSNANDQLLGHSSGGGVITTNPMAVIPSTSTGAVSSYPGTPSNLQQQAGVKASDSPATPVLVGQQDGLETEPVEPETLCEKCGIDFLDEPSRKLHEKSHILITNPAEDESVKAAKGPPTKRFLRTYVCSTCSYTSATKKMMMQHQRAHTGFELICKAEDCQFSTPFENTLKEHIQNDHGSEENVRCPHCGLRMPTTSAFNSHWRLHHQTICSLCVNIYRIRYDVKENDIHDVICKMSPSSSSTTSTSSVFSESVNPSLLLKMEPLTSADFHSLPLVDDLAGLVGISEVTGSLVDDGSLLKKSKLDMMSPPFSSTATLYKRESIKFLPRLVEITVAPMSPKFKRKHLSNRSRRKRKRKWNINKSVDNPYPNFHSSSISDSINNKNNKRINRIVRMMQISENFKRKNCGVIRVTQRRRYCQKGTFSWLYRNPRVGFKCSNSLCENKCSWRYPRKTGLILHKLWYHRMPRFKCDICGLQFPHLYQAYLHKITKHDNDVTGHLLHLQQNQQQQSLAATAASAQLHQQNMRHFNPPPPTQISAASVVTSGRNPMLS